MHAVFKRCRNELHMALKSVNLAVKWWRATHNNPVMCV